MRGEMNGVWLWSSGGWGFRCLSRASPPSSESQVMPMLAVAVLDQSDYDRSLAKGVPGWFG